MRPRAFHTLLEAENGYVEIGLGVSDPHHYDPEDYKGWEERVRKAADFLSQLNPDLRVFCDEDWNMAVYASKDQLLQLGAKLGLQTDDCPAQHADGRIMSDETATVEVSGVVGNYDLTAFWRSGRLPMGNRRYVPEKFARTMQRWMRSTASIW